MGYYGFGNAGDEAVLSGIVRSFADRCSKAELIALSDDPAATEEQHGIKAVGRMSPAEVVAVLRDADLLISGGGSLLQDVTSSRSLYYYLSVMWFAKRLRTKVMVYAQGIGPLNGRMSRILTRRVLNQVDLITVRDQASKLYLEELGVSGVDIRVTADAAFAVEPASDEEAGEILHAAGAPTDVPLMGVSLRPWQGREEWLPSIATGVESAASRIGATPVFLPMQRDQDLSLCVQVASKMSIPTVVIPTQLNPRQAMAVIGRMSMVVGMRLHALIFAASMGVPFVGISYDPKVDAFVRRIMQEEPLKLTTIESGDVTAAVNAVWEHRQELSSAARLRIQDMKDISITNADLACDLISK